MSDGGDGQGQQGAVGAGGNGGGDGAGGASGGGAAGGDGGAASLLTDPGSSGGDGGSDGGVGGAAWYKSASDKPLGEGKKSNQEWLGNKKYADLDATVNAFRELEGRFLAGDKIVVPKEGDAPEVVEAYHKAIGRPDIADDYEVTAPEGQELDQGLVDKMREVAFGAGVPKAAFEAMVQGFNEYGADLLEGQSDAALAAKQQGAAELRKEWGADFDAKVASANKAMAALEIDGDYVSRIEAGLGTADTMKLLEKIGRGVGEDALLGGGGQKFSMSLEAARTELASMKKGEKAEAIMKGAKDLTERRKFLLAVVSQHEAAEAKRAANS